VYAKQKQVIESFVRVLGFLRANPANPPATYAGPGEVLEESVRQLRSFAGDQLYGRQFSAAELRRQEQVMQRIADRHMRPIVTIARAQIEVGSDVRLPDALKMPRSGIGVTKFLQATEAMIKWARTFEATFVANGRPADFIAQFVAATAELEQVLDSRGTLVGTHVGAKKGMRVMLRRGRRAVDRLDSVVRVAFEGNEVVLEKWRVAKRVQAIRGVSSSANEVTPVEQLPAPASTAAPEPAAA
jgi:hypothetical protein